MGVAEDDVTKPRDGEVKKFYLMTADEIKTALLRNEFKTNSAAVMVDYPGVNSYLHHTLPFAKAPDYEI